MNRSLCQLVFVFAIFIASFARGESAQPSELAGKVDLSELRALSLQDRQTVKTWDTFARQVVSAITGRSRLDDNEPLFTVLDMAFRPEAYGERNILKIKNVPLRKDIGAMPGVEKYEAQRILEEGTVSLRFWSDPNTQTYLRKIQQDAVWKSEAIATVQSGANALDGLMIGGPSLRIMSFIPPAAGDANWHSLPELHGNIERLTGGMPHNVIEGYDDTKLAQLVAAVQSLSNAWDHEDAGDVQTAINKLVTLLPEFVPGVYPSNSKRHVEVWYNKLYKLTLPGAALYFIAFTFFLVAAYSPGGFTRRCGVAFMVAGLLLHTVGVFVRWWLDQKSTGSWFYSIPIKNQFESVMMSAWFGVIVGLALEIWKKKSLFGAAACFVGWLSLIALFTVPYVFGKDIGNEIGRSQGILMSYWLYIHVTLAAASYALIGMSFLLGIWWLARFKSAPADVQAMRGTNLSADSDDSILGQARPGSSIGVSATASASAIAMEPSRALLARLDAANLVILQLAFWILGVAIIFGAIWADVSWGRPWGWDPKETFALVTWIVYLIVIHIRLVTLNKAYWTAILTIIGFFVMLFNWIGVNYFLVGLHSYA